MKPITATYRVTLMPLESDEAYDNVMDVFGQFETMVADRAKLQLHHVALGGAVALQGSRSMPGRTDLNNIRYTREVILVDPGFRLMDAVQNLTVLERVEEGSPR